ncbi:MAG: protein translocase subunit SecF [Selenomonas sp.]|jgi:preprotein translocase subunit SecF|nr:protein translocase subunit SecF [Selenomonas sp.]
MNKLNIAGHTKLWFIMSLIVIIPGIFCMFTKGFNFGIDFTGGTIIDMKFEQPVTISQVRTSLAKYGLDGATIQLSGAQSDVMESQDVMIRATDMEEDQRKEVMASLKTDVGDYQVLREEKVGATIGGELITNAVLALVVSWILIIAYVAYRFEWRFGVAAVLALIHDILIVLSVFSLTGRQVDSSFIAALLTIVGYSINDTIVIFDRIRENLKLHFRRGGDIAQLVNTSILQTLTRSLYTVFTVLFTTMALYLFGGDTTKDFAFALLIGFACGCYSSIFIASPLWIVFRKWGDKHKAQPKVAEAK